MFKTILAMQKEKKYIIQGVIVFALFMTMYFLLDSLNLSYKQMIDDYGIYLLVINILLNVIMALVSAFMWNVSSGLVKLTGREGKGSFMSGIAYVFGLLTYGCTPCVIALFSTIGLTFSVAVLPLAGLPYKFMAFGLLILGLIWLIYETNHVKCKVKEK
ncbi:MAG TPA: hypothetical protein PK113_02010 [Bacillota bacterium]|nr:hypothetical protein [Bacillota bacterium]